MQKLKRIGATLVGSLMASSTLLAGALAADLSAFKTMTTADTVVVVGANAATADVVGGINIAAALARNGASATVTGAGTVTEVTGGVALDNPSEKLYLGSAINSVRDVLTAKDLPNLLAKGTFQDDDGTTYDYSQYIEVGSNTIRFYQEDTDQDPIVEIQLDATGATPLYTLRVDFNKQVDFTATESKGNSLTLFGQDFTIGSETDSSKLVLYKSSEEITMNKDDEATVTVGGNTYTIKVLGFDTGNDEVILTVNGETNSVKEGNSKKIAGLQIYAKTVTAWDNGNQGIAVLQIGSEKITLEDGQPVMVGDDETDVDGTMVSFGGGDPSALSTIQIKVFAPDSDNDYIAAGESFTDLFTGNFKVAFGGITPDLKSDSRDQIKFRVSGDYKGYVSFTDVNGESATVYFAYGSSTADTVNFADDTNKAIYAVEGASAGEDEIVFLAPGNERYTHIVRIKNIKTDASAGYVEFTDLITGETYKTEEGTFQTANTDSLDLVVDGKTYTVTLTDAASGSEKVKVEYTPDNKVVVYPAIELNNGETLAFTDQISNVISVSSDNDGAADTGLAGGTFILPTGEITVTYDDDANNNVVAIYVDGTALSLGGSKSVKEGNVWYVYTCGTSGATVSCSVAVEKEQTGTGSALTDPAVLIVEEEDDQNAQNAVIVAVGDGDGSSGRYMVSYETVQLTNPTTGWQGTADNDVSAAIDYYGTYVEKDTSDADHTLVTVWYPDTQVTAQVAIGENPVFGGAAAAEAEITFPSLAGGIGVLDEEAALVKGTKNLILVGGPAVNSLVAELAQAGKTPTLEEWRSKLVGKAILQAIDNPFGGGKIAIIAAGYSADDTRTACMKLATEELSGEAKEITAGEMTDFTYPFPAEEEATEETTE